MCRIAGIADKSLPKEALVSITKIMCDILRHGGPDDEGIYADPDHHLLLGNRRLALIDLGIGGHQPMSYSDGRYHITYNGEIYNHRDLKNELKNAGYTFRTQSDTEVILAAFAAWGTNSFIKFNGMFAFALWDQQTADLYLVRDASGIKPLYYAAGKEHIVFASEIRAFKAVSYLQEKDPDWQVYMMAYGHLPEPVTTLKDVKPLAKGSFIQYNIPTGSFKMQAFTQYSFTEKIDDKAEALELIKCSMKKAVTRHLFSDAPIGIFLSGGVDSAIIAKLAKSEQDTCLNTLSIFFEEEKYSEKKYQDILMDKLAGNHHGFLLKEKEFHDHLPGIINDMDLPGSDGINTWFISKYAKDSGLKSVLSGIGADELFGGYPSFGRMGKTIMLEKLPNSILRSGRFTNSKILRRLCYLSLHSAQGKFLFLRGQFIPGEIAAHLNADEKEIWSILEQPLYKEDISHLTVKNQASWMEINFYLQNQLLRDADVMSMIHGLEIRVPYLDNELMNLVLQIQSNIKYAGTLSKQLLIDAFKNLLPEAVWNRAKMGFSFPFTEWLTKDEYIINTLNNPGQKGINNYQKFVEGSLHWSQLMTLMLLEKSHEN